MKIFDRDSNPIIKAMDGNNKLPKENEVREYADQFITADPCALTKFMPSVDELIEKEIRRPKPEPNQYSWRTEHNPGTRPVDVEAAWIATSFGYNLENCPKPQWNSDQDKDIDIDARCVKEWPDQFVKHLRNCRGDHCKLGYTKASKGSQFNLTYKLHNAFDSYHSAQLLEFHKGLRAQGFVKVRTEPELRLEILTRRRQYPGWRVYTLLGESLVEYFHNIYGSYKWNGSFLIETTSSLEGMQSYESAVFAEPQVRASHEFHFHHYPERIPRWWKLHYASLMKFSIEVDKRASEDRKVQGKPTIDQVRFGSLV